MPTTYAIPNGRTAFDATTYTSNGTTQTVTNNDLGTVGFKPDFLWIKNRSITQNHYLSDSNRGVASILSSNSTAAANSSPNFVTSFNTNGFSFGVDNTANGNSMVGWQWVAGQGVNNTNTAGSITSTVSANTTTGFSIVTWTGTGAAGTVGHGLSTTPQLVIVKNRSASATNWTVWFTGYASTEYLLLNLTDAKQTNGSTAIWSGTPTSSVIQLGTSSQTNGSGNGLVAYCWTPVAGFSQFGSYTGNGSTDGPFIYTGFRPAFVMWKSTTAAYDWDVYDTTRNTFNAANYRLKPNSSDAEQTLSPPTVDILSNGFKYREAYNSSNASGVSYIYMAFAENPFKFANAR